MSKDISELTEEEQARLIRKAQAAYKREYRRRHPEKAKAAARRALILKGLALEEAEKHDS